VSDDLLITLLGSPAIRLGDQPVRGFVSNKAAALAYYLAATGRAHSRDALAALLWPEAMGDQALKNLRDVLSNLRRLLGPHILIDRQTASLAPGAAQQADSRRFEAFLAAAQRHDAPDKLAALRSAVALYRGDFLEGFGVADAEPFEEWALVERERLRGLALDALHTLASGAAQHGAYHEGIAYASRLLALDPTREEAHRQMMRLLALSGQRGAALAQYETCRRVLGEELGIDPDEETEALHRQILSGELIGERAAGAPMRPIHAVPAPIGAFIGRAAELGLVIERLRDPQCRLLTIVGLGGAGKTRLAIEAARRLIPASEAGELFPHGIVFVPLAAIDAAGEQAAFAALDARIADALRFTFSGQEPPHIQLGHYLRERNMLLVLDNCEHLPLATLVVDLLERAPGLNILATSRGRLNVLGEEIVELEGLAFPAELAGRANIDGYEAIQLFRHTARAANPRLAWTPENMAAAARICALVGGLPLGIELAASLARLMSCAEIAHEIESNLNFLQSTRHDLPERHRNLRAVLDHSWQLLSHAEQSTLRQLAIFRGGFGRDAAARVAGASFPLLASLVDNSLLRRASAPDQAGRYELLDLVRQYVAERVALDDSGEEQRGALDRHCRYYLSFLAQRKTDLRGAGQQFAVDEVGLEIENIRGAWRWALGEGYVDLIAQATDGLFYFYEMRSWFQEGAEVFAEASGRLAELDAAVPSRQIQLAWGKLLARQGWCVTQVGQPAEGRALLERSLAILRPLGDEAELVFPLNYLASATYYSGDYAEAERLAAEALAASQTCGDRRGVAVATTVLGQIAYLVGRYEDARRYSRESLAIEQELENRWGQVFTLISLGRVDQALGEYAEARRAFQEGLAIREALGDARGVALCLNHLGDTAAAQADHAEARRCYQQSLSLFRSIGSGAGAATSLAKLGYTELAAGEAAAGRAYFYEALQTAWRAQSLPRTLDAIAGIATAMAADDPGHARVLAALVRRHPAATQESRDRAGELLGRLLALAPAGEQDLTHPETPSLDTAVTALLAAA
jgi:predicted ATPase/DNA-binding SARP family transcriptional activator